MNGIVIDGKFYETVEDRGCEECDLYANDGCKYGFMACAYWDCIFRFSQSLTDKLNEK